MSKMAKFWVAFATAVSIAAVTALSTALNDSVVTPQEVCIILLAALGAVAVYAVPNKQ